MGIRLLQISKLRTGSIGCKMVVDVVGKVAKGRGRWMFKREVFGSCVDNGQAM